MCIHIKMNKHIYYFAFLRLSTLWWQELRKACDYTNIIHNKLNEHNFRQLTVHMQALWKQNIQRDKIRVIPQLTDYNLQDFVCPLHMQKFEQDCYFISNQIISCFLVCLDNCSLYKVSLSFFFPLFPFFSPSQFRQLMNAHTHTEI